MYERNFSMFPVNVQIVCIFATLLQEMKLLKETYAHFLQKLGFGLSLLCALHCLATPFLLVALPALGHNYLSEGLETGLIAGSLLIGSVILTRDYRGHHQKLPLILLSLAFVLAFLVFLTHSHLLQTLSSILLAVAFLINWRMHSRVCTHSH